MPGPQAGAMAPFLARLPTLSLADRALAVHLGVFPSDGRTVAPATYAANDFANAVTDAGRPDLTQGSLARRSPDPEPVSTAPRRRPGDDKGLAPAVRRTSASPAAAKSGGESLAGVRRPTTATSRPSASPGFGGSNPAWALSRGLVPGQPRPKAETPGRRPDPAPAPTPVETAIAAAATAVDPIAPSEAEAKPTEVQVAAVEPSVSPPQLQPAPASESRPTEVRIAALEPSAPPPQAEAVPTGSRLAGLSATLAEIDEPEPAPVAPPKAKPAAKPPAGQRAAATAAAKKPKAAPAEPSRVWVQVAGGAVKAALPREFARLRAKAPKVLGARSAWTTPLNATNRLLVGPFASSKEAQAFVNQLKAEDLSGFAWTSAAGQKVEKLPAK
jgi:hypothetical protein